MIIKYNPNTGDILGYGTIGFTIPDEIPDGEAYIHWNGITPKPRHDYVIQNVQVVLKSEADRQSYRDAAIARSIRGQRDILLSQSDYVILPDAPYSDETQTAYRVYRQALRDLPEQAGFPNNVTWPAKPT